MSGAFVISLDFELHWGVRDKHGPDAPYRAALLGAREAVPRMLDLFERYEIAATWATVGMLFARSADELESFRPAVLPRYQNKGLDPFTEPVGRDETDDPIHFAPSLVERIVRTPRQELATHTYSHYYCLEPGQDAAAFSADLDSACSIAESYGSKLSSIVLPRNQYRPDYDETLLAHGIDTYRGNPTNWMWGESADESVRAPSRRAGRLADAYLPLSGSGTFGWDTILEPSGLANVRASLPLRPFSKRLRHLEPLRLRRLRGAIRYAAKHGEIFHLWWHPHNFGYNLDANLRFLEGVLEEVGHCRDTLGLRSMSMADVAREARRAAAIAPKPVAEASA